ncbi:hypothetical protein N0V82_006911 [Gnomoniopsis sp. IMI 355080]|nr:hypothetical protein N0V82_006911 [Gnomoniopsis sp. IMI 355080]
MAPIFANMSCDPFTGIDGQCIVGSYVPYAVNASSAADYAHTLAFAAESNIRLVIRNTGHDYMGKSTGAGALALWTHHLKDISILNYTSQSYTGPAMKMGAGVQASEAQAAANAQGYVVVHGDCPTVGLAGGYTQGGGTSPLSSLFGLAVDQVLEWEAVTPSGELLVATPDQNPDLYWALTGGGGGTYAVVLSMTVKVHPNMITAGATLSFTHNDTEVYWGIVQTFLMNLPALLDAGGTSYWEVLPGNIFGAPQTFLPNGTAEELESLLQPTLTALNESGISYEFSSVDYPTFQDAFNTLNPDMTIQELNVGGRLIPRSLVATDEASANLTSAIEYIINNNGLLAGVSLNVDRSTTSSNSANPYWRETLFLAFFGIEYDQYDLSTNVAAQRNITNILTPALEAITPNGAAYLNEADYNQPNWQDVFYGSNYERLLSIKHELDPSSVLWGKTAVGSEGWEIMSDGRLCKV